MTELIDYIKAENEKSQAWIDEDPENRFAGMLSTDVEWWEEIGVVTVHDFKRHMLINEISDFYKDVHGFRPGFMKLNEMSLDELEAEMDSLSGVAERVFAEEKASKDRAVILFEETVKEVQSYCSCDRETAIKYLIDAENINGDKDYFEYLNGIPYGYLKDLDIVIS